MAAWLARDAGHGAATATTTMKPTREDAKRARLAAQRPSQTPPAAQTNNAKEILALAYLAKFREQFVHLYPHRVELFLSPRNECAVRKFVSTFVQRTQLPFVELYDMAACAAFVSGAVTYERLERPFAPPDTVQSPATTLSCKRGDSFDMAVLLTSLLESVGYDAFCVSGYADAQTATYDVEQKAVAHLYPHDREIQIISDGAGVRDVTDAVSASPPRISDALSASSPGSPREQSLQGREGTAESDPPVPEGGEERARTGSPEAPAFKLFERPALQSSFLASVVGEHGAAELPAVLASLREEADKRWRETAYTENASRDEPTHAHSTVPIGEHDRQTTATGERGQQVDLSEADGPSHRSVPARGALHAHAWVVVRAGAREVADTVFIEPSTGEIFDPFSSPYFGVEMVWNSKNAWINMQGSKTDVAELSWDIDDVSDWEHVFILHQAEKQAPESPEADTSKTSYGHRKRDSVQDMPADDERTSRQGSAEDLQRVSSRPSSASNAPNASDTETLPVVQPSAREVLDPPPAWSQRLQVTREEFLQRYPNQKKLLRYRDCRVDLFGEYTQPNGLVKRVILYQAGDGKKVAAIHEWYKHRDDHMRRRTMMIDDGAAVEYFDRRSRNGLRIFYISEARAVREFVFYQGSRLDGLLRYKELPNGEVFQEFSLRDDRLTSRHWCASRKSENPVRAHEPESLRPTHVSNNTWKDVVEKAGKRFERHGDPGRFIFIREQYARDRSVAADIDVHKMQFEEAVIRETSHCADAQVAPVVRSYEKDPKSGVLVKYNAVLQSPYVADRKKQTSASDFKLLVAAEKECVQAIRELEREIRSIASGRTQSDKHVHLLLSEQAKAQEKYEKDQKERKKLSVEKKAQRDYLAPFLPENRRENPASELSRAEAMVVREQCLRALKDRLVERANIIQKRLDEENEELQRRQLNFQKRDHIEKGEEEEYEEYCNEATFRIEVLKQRLQKHEESALQKYRELDERLRNDTRLRSLQAV